MVSHTGSVVLGERFIQWERMTQINIAEYELIIKYESTRYVKMKLP